MLIKTGVFISNPFACYEIATGVIYLLVCCETHILRRKGICENNKVKRWKEWHSASRSDTIEDQSLN